MERSNFTIAFELTKNYTFNLSSRFATYAYTFDKNGEVTTGDRTEWSYGRFGRFSGWGSSFNYTFNNETWKKWFGPKDDKDQKDKDKDRMGRIVRIRRIPAVGPEQLLKQ